MTPSPLLFVTSGLLAGVGAFIPVELPTGRRAYFVLSHVSFALFMLVGPAGLLATLAPPCMVAVALLATSRREQATGLLVTSTSLGLSTLGVHAVVRATGAHYPLPLDSGASLVRLLTLLVLGYALHVVLQSVAQRVRGGEAPVVVGIDPLERPGPLSALGAMIGGPLQVLGMAVFHLAGEWAWVAATLFSLVVNTALPPEVRRVQRLRQLLTEEAERRQVVLMREATRRIAHDLRHQVGLIGLSLHRITEELEGSDASPEVLREELRRLERVRADLRAVIDAEVDGPVTPRVPDEATSWEALVHAPLSRLRLLAQERGVVTEVSCIDEPDVHCPDMERLGQAWFNLVENAVSAAQCRVLLSARVSDGQRELRVEDDGPGMSDEVLARATEPFFTTKEDGTGMGLSIARAVAEDHGGDLRITRLETGLAVSLHLPHH